jgi:hypothetical protein
VPDTTYSVAFRLYTVASGGTQFWTETQAVRTKSGLFSTLLGSVTPIGSMPDAGAVYLGMAVAGGAELTPRVRIVSAAYAYKADTANYALAAPGGGDNAWVRGTPDSVLFTTHYVGLARGGADNALYGDNVFTHVNLGASCTTGTDGLNVEYATVSGGERNSARQTGDVVGGGRSNRASGGGATVCGGSSNSASGGSATVAGGYENNAAGSDAAVGGGAENTASGHASVVGGGEGNTANTEWAVVGGGFRNTVGGLYAIVGGGFYNAAGNQYSTVGGGYADSASGYASTVGGGYGNKATGGEATVAGGDLNIASGDRSSVGGGLDNVASGEHTVVAGGRENVASGQYAMIPGGWFNSARGGYCLAAGNLARANHSGCFVWGDSSSLNDSVFTTAEQQFRVRARGGTWFFSNAAMTTGAYLAAGSNSWASACDSTTKEDFREVDRQELLERVAALRVRNYKMRDQDDGTRHIGPVAQEFAAAFGVGENNTSINMADADGVLLAAVQALYEQSRVQQAEIAALKAELARMK